MVSRFVLGTVLVAGLFAGNNALAVESYDNGFSGMAQIDASRYLVVHDVKSFQDGPRLSIYQYEAGGKQQVKDLLVQNWQHIDGRPSDLESVCKLPQGDSDFLVAESGYWQNKFGRIFQIHLEGELAEVRNVFQLPLIKNNGPSLPPGDNFEGLVCIAQGKNVIVVLGERGGDATYADGVLRVGLLDTSTNSISWSVIKPDGYVVKAPGSWHGQNRSISDLHLDKTGNIWASAVEDTSDDGPFRSIIYKVAKLSVGPEVLKIVESPHVAWVIDGFKVEALSGANGTIKDSVMSFGTEDENFNGVWRPLFKAL